MFAVPARCFACLLGLIALVWWGGASAKPPAVDKTDAASCAFHARSEDRDPAGQNIRAAPRGDAEVIGRLPPMRKSESVGDYFVEVRVIGAKNGWFLIDRAEFEDYGDGKPGVAFRGEGWISGRYLQFDVEDAPVRAAPAKTAALVGRAQVAASYNGNGEYLQIGRALSCKGAWIEIEGDIRDAETRKSLRKVRGWVTGGCSNQVTTCS